MWVLEKEDPASPDRTGTRLTLRCRSSSLDRRSRLRLRLRSRSSCFLEATPSVTTRTKARTKQEQSRRTDVHLSRSFVSRSSIIASPSRISLSSSILLSMYMRCGMTRTEVIGGGTWGSSGIGGMTECGTVYPLSFPLCPPVLATNEEGPKYTCNPSSYLEGCMNAAAGILVSTPTCS